jgi:hypothetical protein
MFSHDFVLSVLQGGKICKEESGIIKIPFGTSYVIRLRNKHRLKCATDIYIDGEKTNEIGQIVVPGNDYIDIEGYLKSNNNNERFQFVKLADGRVKQPNETQNGLIEVKFYLQKETEVQKIVEHYYDYTYRPIWIYHDDYLGPYRPFGGPYWYSNYTIGGNFGGGGTSTSAGVKTNNLDGEISYGMASKAEVKSSELLCNPNKSNGATIGGGNFEQNFNSVHFDLKQEPITLRLQLIGYEADLKKCWYCHSKIKPGDKYCSICGAKTFKKLK